MEAYHAHLYRIGETVLLQHKNQIITATLKGVNDEGLLMISDPEFPAFRHGEADWIW